MKQSNDPLTGSAGRQQKGKQESRRVRRVRSTRNGCTRRHFSTWGQQVVPPAEPSSCSDGSSACRILKPSPRGAASSSRIARNSMPCRQHTTCILENNQHQSDCLLLPVASLHASGSSKNACGVLEAGRWTSLQGGSNPGLQLAEAPGTKRPWAGDSK